MYVINNCLKIKKSLAAVLLIMCSIQYVWGQAIPVYKQELKEAFDNDYQFKEMYIDSMATTIGRDGLRVYYVYYVSNDYKMRAEYNDYFIWRLTYIYIPYERLPNRTKKHLSANYNDYQIVDIRFQDAPNDSYYKVDVVKGSRRWQLRYLAEGHFLKAKVR